MRLVHFVAVLLCALLAAFASVCAPPAARAQTTPGTPCSATAASCLFIPLLRRDALPVSSITPLAFIAGNAYIVTASNGYAYVGLDRTPTVVDARQATKPQVVGRYTLPGKYEPSPTSMVQANGLLYVTTRYVFTSCCLFGDLLILNVQQLSTPVLLGRASTSGLNDVAISGTNAFVTGVPWVSAAPQLAVYDVSNPAAPTRRNSRGSTGGGPVAVTGTTAYVSTGVGISVLDVSDSVTSTLQTTLPISNAQDIVVDGTNLYVAAGAGGVAVFDISTPSAPTLVGQIATGGTATQLQVVNGRAFVAQGTAGIAVIDVTQPHNLKLLLTYDTPGQASDVAVDGDVLYVADGTAGLRLLRLVP